MDDRIWYLDTGATHNMTGKLEWLHHYTPSSHQMEVQLGDNGLYTARGHGTVKLKQPSGDVTVISKVYYIPGLAKNLLSVNELTSNGSSIEFFHQYCIIKAAVQHGDIPSPSSINSPKSSTDAPTVSWWTCDEGPPPIVVTPPNHPPQQPHAPVTSAAPVQVAPLLTPVRNSEPSTIGRLLTTPRRPLNLDQPTYTHIRYPTPMHTRLHAPLSSGAEASTSSARSLSTSSAKNSTPGIVPIAGALSSDKAPQWRLAMESKIASLQSNRTWVLAPLPHDRQAISCRWLLRRKYNLDGTVACYKARLVVRGFSQEYGVDYSETFFPTLRLSTFRALLAIGTHLDLEMHQMDVETAFLNGYIDSSIYMQQPPHFVDPQLPNHFFHLHRSMG
ncbi:hypothetical protein L7F22_030266 [Adiantum nelumboides]|nr:hypothetical protein [Adiantum nelumboides]